MEAEDVYSFHPSDIPSLSFNAFNDMKQKGELCDVTILVQNLALPAHRVILAGAIPYFHVMFTSGMLETKQEEIPLSNLDPEAVESLINFAYSHTVEISSGNVYPLLEASDFLQVSQVTDACGTFLSERLNSSNVLRILTAADNTQHQSLIDCSIRYITEYFEEFSTCRDFESVPFRYLKDVISSDDLNVGKEETVIRAVIKWVKALPSERQALLPQLLNEVRMIYLTTHFLHCQVASEELITSSAPCTDLIEQVKHYNSLKNLIQGVAEYQSSPDEVSLFANMKIKPRKFYNYTADGVYAICYSTPRGDSFMCFWNFLDKVWYNLTTKVKQYNAEYATAVGDKMYVFLRETIQTFHLQTKEWEELQPRHTDIFGAAIVPHENVIYCFGSVSDELEDRVRCFDTQQCMWLKEKRMKTGRYYAAAASLGEFIYVTGGKTITDVLSSVERYSPSTGQSNEVSPMLTPRDCHGCTSVFGKVYVCGGWTENGLSQTAEVYDPRTNQWSCISSMKIARCNFSVFSHVNKIYALGGETGNYNSTLTIENYDPLSDQWDADFWVPLGFKCAARISATCN